MNKKDSIIFQLSIFFVFIFVLINALIIIQFLLDNNTQKTLQTKRYLHGLGIVIDSKFTNLKSKSINEKLKLIDLELSDISHKLIKDFGQRINNHGDRLISIYIYNKKKYILFNPPSRLKERNNMFKGSSLRLNKRNNIFKGPPQGPLLLIDNSNRILFKLFLLVGLVIIDILLIWFYIFLLKKLKPLTILKNEIVKFSQGDLYLNTKTKGKDEIAQVANEFNKAILRVRELTESRNLFLRNIMHELKTPITKGKIITDTYDDSKRKDILVRVFNRFEYLLNEFSKIEELTSGHIKLEQKTYRVVDLIDQSLDILLLDLNDVNIQSNSNLKINVDFDLFSITLKNLIDNAIKYNTNGKPEIIIDKNSINIKNKGKKLTKEISQYYKPFNRDYEKSYDGLGLGLYISNNIINLHGYKLEYDFKDEYHIFKIIF
jgi:two-component system OmpR family sensor kinase